MGGRAALRRAPRDDGGDRVSGLPYTRAFADRSRLERYPDVRTDLPTPPRPPRRWKVAVVFILPALWLAEALAVTAVAAWWHSSPAWLLVVVVLGNFAAGAVFVAWLRARR